MQSLENACWETAQKRPHTGYVDAGEDIYSEAIAPHTKARTLERVDEAFHGCQCFCLSALGKTVFENAFNYSLFYFFLSLHFRLNCDAWSPQAEDWLEATPMQVHHARHVQLMAIGWHMQMTKVLKFVLFFVCFFLKFQCTQMQPEIPYLCFRSENLRTKTYSVFI